MIRKFFLLSASALIFLAACKKNSTSSPGITIAQDTYTLPGDTLFPEGIVYQPATGNFFTGSTTSGDIIKVNVQTGVTALWAPGLLQGRRFTTGLKLDDKNRLWICGGEDKKISVLDVNGGLVRVTDIGAMFGAGFINDCASDGASMYFTDSRVQKIYRAATTDVPGDVETWLTFTDAQIPYALSGTNANGIVVTPDNKYLIIVVSSSGKLYRVTIASKAITEISLNIPVTSGDGLVLDGTTLYVSRNSLNLIYPVTLSPDYSSGTVGTGFGTNLKFNTTMAKADKYFLVVNGQLDKKASRTQSLPFTVSRVTIP